MKENTIQLDPDRCHQLEQVAQEDGKTVSELLRMLVDSFPGKHKTHNKSVSEDCYTVAKRAGIIGMIESAPSDLSTNPKYFEGFGT